MHARSFLWSLIARLCTATLLDKIVVCIRTRFHENTSKLSSPDKLADRIGLFTLVDKVVKEALKEKTLESQVLLFQTTIPSLPMAYQFP
mmetsp:Transcript_11901/g.15662  ORF Transcript_11901/g.15662 Transcript_11901/m.15662 type:complete len:89 (+) Transcript_11901:304-570(+)